ncbi:MAG: alpha-glucan family phosphorylase, partial [Myxococcota bacterium]|nr:alpha-glucan family phosphorylase [Myxococcota bacterium]
GVVTVEKEERHTAFVLAERLREEWSRGFHGALEAVREGTVFTTHTPVPAGHDRFPAPLLERAFEGWPPSGGPELSQLLTLGSEPGVDLQELCMTVLALRGCRASNGVSEKHGEVSREMWQAVWPDQAQVPIGHVTNGVHAGSWLGPELQALLDRWLPAWRDRLSSGEPMDELFDLDPEELWAAHRAQKQHLVRWLADRSGVSVDPDALLVGFARRFATYKRGDLLLSDFGRIAELLGSEDRPVQFVFAGKAHPQDEGGKAILQRLCQAARDPRTRGRIVVIEDYEIAVGRTLVQGVDLWLNNPRRPREASGTSGQKVAMNGGLNCSTLDGWWIEGLAQQPLAGWAVGDLAPAVLEAEGDRADALDLYRLLEEEIVPCFFDRDEQGLPREWVRRMAASIAVCLPAFNTDRMLADYVRRVYRVS